MLQRNALIALSGGLDSATLLYEYAPEIACAVSFRYGSKHNNQEIACAAKACAALGIKHIEIALPFFAQHFSSALLQGQGEIPQEAYSAQNVQATVVPFRNGIMLSILAGLAESRGLKKVFIANHFGDHALYPDCTEAFATAMKEAILKGTTNGVELCAPYTTLSKTDIVKRGAKLGVPFADTYSCYEGAAVQCGVCATCRERKQAFREAQVADPTTYKQ